MQTGIAECDIFHLQQTVEFAFGEFAFVVAMGFGIFHHVFHALHLATHLHDGLRSVHDLVDWREEGRHEALEGQQHTYGQFSFQDKQGTENQDGRIDQAGDEYG